jgi:carbon monoxide dehydrogenase subunit G
MPAQSSPARGGIRSPTNDQIQAVRGFLKRGLVVAVETTPDQELAQVTLIGRVKAPLAEAFDILADPAALAEMQPAMGDIEVTSREAKTVRYDWRYRASILRLRGTNTMRLRRPDGITWHLRGSFAEGPIRWKLFPDGNDTIASVSLHIDSSNSSNVIMRWIARATPHMRESQNLGYGIVCLRGLQNVAAQRQGRAQTPTPSAAAGQGPLRPLTSAQVARLAPLLKRGVAGIVESDRQGRIAQAALAQPIAAPVASVGRVLRQPERWGGPIKGVEIRPPRREGDDEPFKFVFRFPIFRIRTDMVVRHGDQVADVTSPNGDLRGSLVRFQLMDGVAGSVVAGTARFRPRQANFILRRIIDADPYSSHGLNAAILAVLLRSFKTLSEDG